MGSMETPQEQDWIDRLVAIYRPGLERSARESEKAKKKKSCENESNLWYVRKCESN